MLIDVKKGYWYRFKLVLDDKPVEGHDNTTFYADSFTILTARKAMVNEILYNITIIAQAALNRGLDFLPVKRFEIEYNPYYFLENEIGTRFPVSRESRTLGCYARGLSYEEKNMPTDEKPGFEKFGFKSFDIPSEDRELSEVEVNDLLKSIVELTKDAFDEELKRVKDYRDNYAKQHITNEMQYLLKNTSSTKEELLAIVKEFVEKD